jgi:hypothetical protein
MDNVQNFQFINVPLSQTYRSYLQYKRSVCPGCGLFVQDGVTPFYIMELFHTTCKWHSIIVHCCIAGLTENTFPLLWTAAYRRLLSRFADVI